MNKYLKYTTLSVVAILAVGLISFKMKKKLPKEPIVKITTKFGDMKLKLYNETPLHRDNFIKLTKEKYFEDLLFHRVINQFMIQGGDPNSKGAPEGKMLGEGGPGYTIPAEFVPGIYHKKGALAAAREGDEANPEKKSSGSQFYIVQGRVFDSLQLATFEERRMNRYRSVEFKNCLSEPENKELLDKYMQAMKTGDRLTSADILNKTKPMVDERMKKYEFTEKQWEIYTTIGGTPHLDNSYTVFGELIEGFDVLDSIAQVKTDRNNRPLEDVVMSVKVIR
ncbi:peptidylprolyl isomerase [bacterium SCSIO 12643]|nr:peptidylprolyl isomerase [bacterium SCSIO 12643]